jgi:hypothetical protein
MLVYGMESGMSFEYLYYWPTGRESLRRERGREDVLALAHICEAQFCLIHLPFLTPALWILDLLDSPPPRCRLSGGIILGVRSRNSLWGIFSQR